MHKCYSCGRFVISDETMTEDCDCAPGRRMRTIVLGFFKNLDEAQQYVLRNGLPDDLGPIAHAYAKRHLPRRQNVPFDITETWRRQGGIH